MQNRRKGATAYAYAVKNLRTPKPSYTKNHFADTACTDFMKQPCLLSQVNRQPRSSMLETLSRNIQKTIRYVSKRVYHIEKRKITQGYNIVATLSRDGVKKYVVTRKKFSKIWCLRLSSALIKNCGAQTYYFASWMQNSGVHHR